MLLHPGLPDQRAGRSVHRINVGADVAEIDGDLVGASDRRHADCGADPRLSRKCPACAAALRIERVDLEVGSGDEKPAADDGRLGVDNCRAGKAERPFQLQPRDRRLRDPSHLCRLEAAVGEIDAPAVPAWSVETKAGVILRALPGCVVRSARGVSGFPGHEGGDRCAIGISPILRDQAHGARGDRAHDCIERHRLQDAAAGRADPGAAVVVTLRAALRIERRAGVLRECRNAGPDQERGGRGYRLHGLAPALSCFRRRPRCEA